MLFGVYQTLKKKRKKEKEKSKLDQRNIKLVSTKFLANQMFISICRTKREDQKKKKKKNQ